MRIHACRPARARDTGLPGAANYYRLLPAVLAGLCAQAACLGAGQMELTVYETNRAGLRMEAVPVSCDPQDAGNPVRIRIDPEDRRQEILGIGGALTESSGYALGQIEAAKRREVLERYFGSEGAGYSMVRVPVASCDFSTGSYTYAPVAGDTELEHFSIERDRRWVLPLIEDARAASTGGFRILASPWTAPPWMKDNNAYFGGRLKPEHYGTFADYWVRYLRAYQREGIDIWGITPLNEPLGNGSQWESMEFSPKEMAQFIGDNLGPALEEAGLDPELYIFDQNRDEVIEWAELLLHDEKVRKYSDGVAVHWYSHTTDPLPGVLDELRERFAGFPVIHSEGCIDAMGNDEAHRSWLEDDWYWRAEATDWGYYFAPEDKKQDHPKYRPFYRYTRDILVGLNHGMAGWIDWNIVLDFDGGPNHADNFCGAPVLVDGETNSVYYTPLYYAVAHFSRFIRPGSVVLGSEVSQEGLLCLAAENPDGSRVAVVFNPTGEPVPYTLSMDGKVNRLKISAQGLQTIVMKF